MFLMIDKMAFGQWLQKERNIRGWTQSDLGRKSGKDRAVINKIESGGALPAVETFIALADALKLSPITLFRKAGLLPEGGEGTSFEDWKFLIEQLAPEEEEEIRKIIEMKIDRRQQLEASARASKFKSNKVGK